MEYGYRRRILDDILDEVLPDLTAISLEGARAVGKTVTARRRASTAFNFEIYDVIQRVRSFPELLSQVDSPVLIDEWQRWPEVWDHVRRLVDDHVQSNFILTGSASPVEAPIHSGAGRIIGFRMRPLSFAEREVSTPTVRLSEMLCGTAEIGGETDVSLADYIHEIVLSGLPGVRRMRPRVRETWIEDYVRRVVDHDFSEQGHPVRRRDSLLRWLQAYAASTGQTTSYAKIAAAAARRGEPVPSSPTTIAYRDVLASLYLLDPVPAWTLGQNYLSRVSQRPKHFLADPALTVSLLGLDEGRLQKSTPDPHEDGPFLGSLFEALVALSLKTYAQVKRLKVSHFRTYEGNREVDFIVHKGHAEAIAVEVKLTRAPGDDDVRNLLWLKEQMGDQLVDMAVITTGRYAYRRPDGVAVIPLALLGP